MNLTVRAAIAGAMGKSVELANGLKDKLEASQELSEAVEALYAARNTGASMLTIMDELEVASKSLEAVGFSDEWLNTINIDGNFVEAINLDMTALVGTKEEKTKVAMEGLWDTIWGFIKKIWDFLVNLFNKVVNFIKSLLGIFRSEKDEVHKMLDMLNALKICKDPLTAGNHIGEELGTDYDMRDLIQRQNVCACLSALLIEYSDKAFGIQNKIDADTGVGMFDDAFVEVALANSSSNSRDELAVTHAGKNVILNKFIERARKHPDELSSAANLFMFRNFEVDEHPSVIDLFESSGIRMVPGDHPEISIGQMTNFVKRVTYTAAYQTIEDYLSVINAYDVYLVSDDTLKNLRESTERHARMAKDAQKFANKYRDAGKWYGGVDVDKIRKNRAFVCFSKWMMEISQISAGLISSYSATFSEAKKLRVKMDKAIEKVQKEMKLKEQED